MYTTYLRLATHDGEANFPGHPAMESHDYDDKRPRRRLTPRFLHFDTKPESNVNADWNIRQKSPPFPNFPSTADAVATAASEAVIGTLYQKQKLDPNMVRNVLTTTWQERRPVRSPWDVGRIGVEIDHAQHLFDSVSEEQALRRIALLMAGKLSCQPWERYETKKDSIAQYRPVVVYFNTIKQALMASHDLQLLRKESVGCYNNVTIMCLCGEEKLIPASMTEKKTKNLANKLSEGIVDPTKGLLLVVQPTDYNNEYRPPGPILGSVEALQQLLARAAIHELATVLVSPRFLAHTGTPYTGTWDQSGYQQSATFGGIEPPRGPTPWVLRDFTPPVFCWVGQALALPRFIENRGKRCVGVSLVQSVMQEGHSWDVFLGQRQGDRNVEYEYLTSTHSAGGRPTRNLLRRLLGEFIIASHASS